MSALEFYRIVESQLSEILEKIEEIKADKKASLCDKMYLEGKADALKSLLSKVYSRV